MDLAQVRGHADGLGRQAEELQALVQQVDALVDQAGWAWPGPDADAFRDAWFSSYRSSMGAAATQLGDAVAVLYRQIEEQAAASGESLPYGMIPAVPGLPGDVGFDPVGMLRDVLERTGVLRSVEGIAVDLWGLANGGIDNIPWSRAIFRHLHGTLGVLGLFADGADIIDGYLHQDMGQLTTGGIGAALATLPLPLPVKIAGEGTLLLGQQVLPTNNQEYEGSYELAMRTQFGSGWTPENCTPAQAEWGTHHYEGASGFVHSLSDGLRYKFKSHFDPEPTSGGGGGW
ncbi:WXG100 family type VII secretion target [Nocardioides sp. MH1]|uniref:WXG100 family type VII secretion target n=1 Tax=Nocardioides sp. MH1 TaxID=3242490 RepID=UPI003520162C